MGLCRSAIKNLLYGLYPATTRALRNRHVFIKSVKIKNKFVFFLSETIFCVFDVVILQIV